MEFSGTSGGNSPEEIHLLYQNATANLATLKNRQWQVLVLFSAPVAFLIIRADEMSMTTKEVMTAAIVVGALATAYAFGQFQKKMKQERAVLGEIYHRFGEDFRECRKAKGDVQEPDCFESKFFLGITAYLMLVVFYSVAVFWNWPWTA